MLLLVAANPKHLGASIGFIAILHTWSQNLMFHPRLHCVIPGGGLSSDGTSWIRATVQLNKLYAECDRAPWQRYQPAHFRITSSSLRHARNFDHFAQQAGRYGRPTMRTDS